ncbi:MAG: GNAT family N-acetyltransferase [Pseudomonadota bacterium]
MEMEKIVTQPTITAERFDLRPLRRSDAGLMTLYSGDERVARMTTRIPHPLPPGTAEAFITRAMADNREEDVWAIDGTKDGGAELMGIVSLQRMDRNQSELHYWVAEAFWNTGLATDAVAALVTANPAADKTLFACTFQDNPASARVLTHCGFEYLGDAESYCVARDATVPTWTYSKKL